MGWETAIGAGFGLLSASNKIDQGNAQAQALADQGTYQEKNIADNTVRSVGKLQTSFLNSGIALDDLGGTSAIIGQAFSQGYTDISRTQTNADNASKNAYNTSRSAALESLAGGLVKSGISSSVGGFLDDQTSNLFNSVGQETGSWLDPSPTGPYLPAWNL